MVGAFFICLPQSMKKFKFHLSPFWSGFIISTLATIVGIVLTVGIAYWQQMNDREEMARKITKITLHNIDVRIDHLEDATKLLAAKDSIFTKLREAEADLAKIPADSLRQDLNMLLYNGLHLTDTKSEVIFSHSFEVWQYLDDTKVIGRISACYSVADFGDRLIEKYESGISEALHDCRMKIIGQGIGDDPVRVARLIANDPQTILAFDVVKPIVRELQGCTETARQLNTCNIRSLGLTQQELSEVGNLLSNNAE